MAGDPFAALGLTPGAGLDDEDVRAAWRRIAAATHPDREDGGDPARYSAAAAAYEVLRTSDGRGEALADSAAARPAGRRAGRPGWRPGWAGAWWRRPGMRLAARVAVAAGVSAAALGAAGWSPGSAGVLAGTLTWLIVVSGRGR